MLSVVIPTLNAAETLPRTLTALVAAAVDGFVREVIVCDGGSTDATAKIADAAGADFITAPRGRGSQLMAGAARARHPWLLFLHADTVLGEGWMHDAGAFMGQVAAGRRQPSAAAFRFRLDDKGLKPRLLEATVKARCRLFGLPYGDQGLLMPRDLYAEIGGFRDLPIMEDVDIARRLGRRRIAFLETPALTSAARYRRDGYLRRTLRNQSCLLAYGLGVPAERIARRYGGPRESEGLK
ncbi:MAG TPA: TIGR04283 family arsenosugar biosynthesis glycosyltransferase [Hyphomicrobium sp.]|nr:TIGR04283 family arsenosugar biosynthesis glycosyltransferase [Hyphomicrobium sp.]